MVNVIMCALYGIYSDGEILITTGLNLAGLMEIAQDAEDHNAFSIKPMSSEEPYKEIIGTRMFQTKEVFWRLKNQKKNRSRDHHIFEKLKNLIKKGD